MEVETMAESCPECQATFANAAELVAHMKEVHQGELVEATPPAPPTPADEAGTVLTCVECGMTFATGEELARHIRMNHPVTEDASVTA